MNNILSFLKSTCLHPQWFVYKNNLHHCIDISSKIRGTVLDIGCADQHICKYLAGDIQYIGLDYYHTATNWYNTKPNVFGDGQDLPIKDESFDTVLLLDVLEHIPKSDKCLSEISRVLKKNGCLVLQVPFLYLIHDKPLDFHRWTSYGLRRKVEKHGFVVKEERCLGKSIETGGLLLNLALGKLILYWAENKKMATISSIFLIPLIVFINLFCWCLAVLSPVDNFMPHGYRLVLEKRS